VTGVADESVSVRGAAVACDQSVFTDGRRGIQRHQYQRAVIAFVCAMPMELRPLRRRLRLRKTGLGYAGRIDDRGVIAVVTGMGTALADAATVRLLDAVDVEWVIVVGITGAIENDTPIGTLVVPELVVNGADGSQHRPKPLRLGNAHGKMWTTDELLLDPAVHADLRARGVVSLDMETAAVAAVCEKRGVPWSVVRAISDRASDGSMDAEIVGLSHPDGRANFWAVARYLVRHRGAMPRLVRLARGSKLATERAADAAIRAVS
jgi:adenosylhomocysteine nucleosidase